MLTHSHFYIFLYILYFFIFKSPIIRNLYISFFTPDQIEYYGEGLFIFSPNITNHAGAKSACVGLGGHLAIIPNAETQAFIQTKGAAYKSAGTWMTNNSDAWIDAVKTSDGTGWEWSTTHDKFYFNTTQRGDKGGSFLL
ncbi:uncharacterized protein LOC144751872 [Ciona intestinalis]